MGDVPLPETVAACACQISMEESRSNNATQNIAIAAVSCIADITVHVQSMCMKQVQYLSLRILFSYFLNKTTFENLQVSVLNVSLCCDKHINPICAHDSQSYFF